MPDIPPPPPLADALRDAVERLADAGVPDPQVDAELLAAHVLGVGRGRGAGRRDPRRRARRREDADALDALVARRATREPLQHLTGTRRSATSSCASAPACSCRGPRPRWSRSCAIDALLAAASPAPIAVDLGTGSGAIALALATEVPHARVFAAENSADAFAWTKENFARVGADNAQLVVHRPRARVPRARRHGLGRRVEPAVRAGCRDPARPGGALLRSARGAVRRRRTASTSCASLSRVGAAARRTPAALIVIEHGEWQGEAIREHAHRGRLARGRHPPRPDACATARRPRSGPDQRSPASRQCAARIE